MVKATSPTVQTGPFREVHVGALDLARFETLLAPAEFEDVRVGMALAKRELNGRTVWNINSTARGGGVAEMLVSLLAYARGASVDARWLVIRGDERFFAITKRLHNRLHGFAGDGGPLGGAEREHYERTLAVSARGLSERLRPGDAVILHDPQTAGLIPHVRALGVTVVWRCHIGVDSANELVADARGFLERYVSQADATCSRARALRGTDWTRRGRHHLALDRRVRAQEPGVGRARRGIDPRRGRAARRLRPRRRGTHLHANGRRAR